MCLVCFLMNDSLLWQECTAPVMERARNEPVRASGIFGRMRKTYFQVEGACVRDGARLKIDFCQ